MRALNEQERLDVIRFAAHQRYDNPTEKSFTEIAEEVDGYTAGVFDDYMSDCPGYAGKVIIIIGGQPELHQVLGYDEDGNLFQFNQDL
jgi:hypothetical protein